MEKGKSFDLMLLVWSFFLSFARWPPLTTQGNYGTVYMTAKDNPTLLTPAPSCSQPMIAELETRQLPQSAQSVEVRLV